MCIRFKSNTFHSMVFFFHSTSFHPLPMWRLIIFNGFGDSVCCYVWMRKRQSSDHYRSFCIVKNMKVEITDVQSNKTLIIYDVRSSYFNTYEKSVITLNWKRVWLDSDNIRNSNSEFLQFTRSMKCETSERKNERTCSFAKELNWLSKIASENRSEFRWLTKAIMLIDSPRLLGH